MTDQIWEVTQNFNNRDTCTHYTSTEVICSAFCFINGPLNKYTYGLQYLWYRCRHFRQYWRHYWYWYRNRSNSNTKQEIKLTVEADSEIIILIQEKTLYCNTVWWKCCWLVDNLGEKNRQHAASSNWIVIARDIFDWNDCFCLCFI